MAISFVPSTRSIPLSLAHSGSSPPTAFLTVAGEVDLATAGLLRERLLDVLREHAAADLEVDFAEVTFLDCVGIGALVGAHNVAVRSERRIRLTRLDPAVRRVLEVTGLLDVLATAADRP